jgi:hypothetical protein
MSARIGFHIGPFYFSQRVGRTQAQKRAAAKARAARRTARAAQPSREERAQQEAARAAALARFDRTYTATVSEMALDDQVCGSFTVHDSTRDARITICLTAASPNRERFLLLHDGDVVNFTMNEAGTALSALSTTGTPMDAVLSAHPSTTCAISEPQQ